MGTTQIKLETGADVMTEAIIVAILSLIGTLAGSILVNRKTSALIEYRMTQLENKMDEINSLVDRVYKLESRVSLLEDKIGKEN